MLAAATAAAAVLLLFLVALVMMAAAAFAFTVLMLVAVSAAAAFTFLMIVLMMVVTAAALAFAVLMLMAVSAAAAFAFLMIVLMMVVTAAALAFTVLMLVAMSAAAAFAFLMIVLMVVVTAAALAFAVLMLQIGQRQNSKTIVDLRNTNAAVNQRTSSFTQHIHVARHVEHLFNCRTNCPEAAFFINEYIIDFNRTKLIGRNAKFNFAFRRMNDLRKLSTLSGCERQCMSLVKQGLSGSGVGRQKLRKRGHIYLILLSGCAAVAGSSTSEKMKAALF